MFVERKDETDFEVIENLKNKKGVTSHKRSLSYFVPVIVPTAFKILPIYSNPYHLEKFCSSLKLFFNIQELITNDNIVFPMHLT